MMRGSGAARRSAPPPQPVATRGRARGADRSWGGSWIPRAARSRGWIASAGRTNLNLSRGSSATSRRRQARDRDEYRGGSHGHTEPCPDDGRSTCAARPMSPRSGSGGCGSWARRRAVRQGRLGGERGRARAPEIAPSWPDGEVVVVGGGVNGASIAYALGAKGVKVSGGEGRHRGRPPPGRARGADAYTMNGRASAWKFRCSATGRSDWRAPVFTQPDSSRGGPALRRAHPTERRDAPPHRVTPPRSPRPSSASSSPSPTWAMSARRPTSRRAATPIRPRRWKASAGGRWSWARACCRGPR